MPSVPNLNIDYVSDLIIDSEYNDDLETLPPDQIEVERKKMKDYLTGSGSTFIQQQINKIQNLFDSISEQVDTIQTAITQTTASNAIPSTLVAGAATGAPNPAYTVIDNSQKKNSILSIISIAVSQGNELKSTAESIHFPLPNSITTVINTLQTLKDAAGSIPG